MDLVVGMGECVVTNKTNGVLRTFALASCVGVTAYCPVRSVAGMVHVVLPAPFNESDRQERPAYFAETGVPLLIHELCHRFGCQKQDLIVEVYGGAQSMWEEDVYNIGKENIEVVEKRLKQLGVFVQKTDLRGTNSRSLAMAVKTGLVDVMKQPMVAVAHRL